VLEREVESLNTCSGHTGWEVPVECGLLKNVRIKVVVSFRNYRKICLAVILDFVANRFLMNLAWLTLILTSLIYLISEIGATP